ncbi:FAD-binding oxidoreductase [Solicola gregarius]|uniref:FAD-binding oxidoreductase n=1 Tax=Solicola gregarius TaxID=2908642 RepID=A0AA46YM98_9ACTN|nr:FAD-binding oxidoreductase [Solicola gregarius]UYM07497.1 FAD-binding oxidoreductase [Solicola gregarius]
MTNDAQALKSDLQAVVRGAVHAPGDPTWDDARKAWNLSVDQHPLAVVEVADADDVVAAVRCAGRVDLPVVPQSTGHAATDDGVTGAILLRMHALDSVEVDTERRIARVGGGTMWKAVLDRLDDTGLLGLGGTAPMISVVGYTLGGGLSWFGRRYGLASAAVRSVDLVTADGDQVTVTEESDPELFWALRGYGGEFGVVTSMEFDLFPSPGVVGARLMFPAGDTRAVLDAFSKLTAAAPPELSVAATILHLPDAPFIPEDRRGRSFVAINAAHLGTLDECRTLLSGIVAAGDAIENDIRTYPMSEVGGIAEDPVDPSPAADLTTLLRDFDSGTVERLLDVAGPDSGTRLLGVNIRHLGGALAEAGSGNGGVAGAIDEPYLVFSFAVPGLSGSMDEIVDTHNGLHAALGDTATGGAPYNFLGRGGPERAYDSAALDRLRTLKRRRDPQGRFRMTRPLPN